MEERLRFVLACEACDLSISEACRQFGVARKTGYKWLKRHREGGVEALHDRPRVAHHRPHALSEAMHEAILAIRHRYPTWGPKKIRAVLAGEHHADPIPATSTIGALLAREGLVHTRRRRHTVPSRTRPLGHATAANDVWCIDLKGWFRTGDGSRCEPLTLQDAHSRFFLRCRAVERHDVTTVWPLMEAAFREFGLPRAIRSDNGPPFATVGAGRLSPLGVRLIKAGLALEHIDPGRPQQNGRLERLHRTLKEETARPPAPTLAGQARRFTRFRRIYNFERPHEALGMDVPAAHYEASPRAWRGRLVAPEYDGHCLVRRVRTSGEIKWRGAYVYLSQALVGEPVGLEEIDTDVWLVRFAEHILGLIGPDGKFDKTSSRMRELVLREQMENCVTHPLG